MIVVSGGTFRNRWILGESEFCLQNVLIRESSKIEGVGLVGRKRVGVQRESVCRECVE